MAIPAWRNTGAGVGATTAITPALPTGLSTNDILLLVCESADSANPITVANQNGGTWTRLGSSILIGTGALTRLDVFWSRYNGSQGDPTTSVPGNHVYGFIIAYSGCVASGDPYEAQVAGTHQVD